MLTTVFRDFLVFTPFLLFVYRSAIGVSLCHGFVAHVNHRRIASKGIAGTLLLSYSEDSSTSDKFNMTGLNERIKEVQKTESELSNRFTMGINQRIQELESSSLIEKEMESGRVSLPVISFDALLPGQKMEGSTEDPTFCRLLMEVGLGGWFVMTSLDFRSRKIRRNGVLCKVDFIDVAKKLAPNKRIPTSVDFVIVGKERCRVIGKSNALKLRIGRWRRVYDDNGEEVVLGWGEETFLDLPWDSDEQADTSRSSKLEKVTDSTEWSMTNVECNLDQNEPTSEETIKKAESLLPLIDEWFSLAANNKTYENFDVTAATRIQRNKPFLSVQPTSQTDPKGAWRAASRRTSNRTGILGSSIDKPYPSLGGIFGDSR